jgi:uncharacterized protein (TIGR03435 family)
MTRLNIRPYLFHNFRMRIIAVRGGLACVCLASLALFGQVANERSLTFDVASVKPKDPNVVDEVEFATSGGRLTATNLTLQMLIAAAYGVEVPQVTGGPGWVATDRFNVLAIVDNGTDDDLEMVVALNSKIPRTMALRLRNLLAERFRLELHTVTKDVTGYELVTAKGGPKFTATKDPTQTPYLGLRQGPNSPGALLLVGRRASTQLLAERLSRAVLRAPVTDRTGIAGEFDFQIEFSNSTEPGPVPSVFTAIQETVGLRLGAIKQPVITYVIDQVERPTSN